LNKILGIAINKYTDDKLDNLNNCLADMNETVSILKQRYCFDDIELLTCLEQTTRKYLFNRLQDFFLNCLEEDNIIILYSGHGEYNSFINTPYWQPSDSLFNDSSTWLNVNDILSFINASKAKHVCLISDSCFSGAIITDKMRGGGFDALNNKKSRLALTSGGIEKVSDGIKEDLSPFTKILCKVLKENNEPKISFSSVAEKVILNFNEERIQTPMFGTLPNTGHDGGSFILELKEETNLDSDYEIENYSLDLNLNIPLNIEYSCNLPLFTESKLFDSKIVNASIQNIAFRIISDMRKYILEESEFMIGRSKEISFGLELDYEIKEINAKYLSLVLNTYSYLGGPYPNNHTYSLNMLLKPERILNIRDILNYSDLQIELQNLFNKYGDEEMRDLLEGHVEYINEENLDFALNNETLFIYLSNHLPRAIHACGYLEIPRTELKLKI